MTMEKPIMTEKEAPVKGIVAQVVTMLNGQAQRYVILYFLQNELSSSINLTYLFMYKMDFLLVKFFKKVKCIEL